VELEARLIDDLLDLTRITRGKFRLEHKSLDLYAVIEKAVATVRSTIRSRGVSVQMELTAPEHQVNGDPVRLQQVFWNVVKNAAKFTPADGLITIRSSIPQPGIIQVSVTDTGIGIAPENIDRIFQAFEQVHHSSMHQFGGLGLGLSISRKLIEAHGGMIWAESGGTGHGATFHITLPLVASATPQQETKAPPEVSPSPSSVVPLRILLVEDHEETRIILERLLKRRGHEVFSAGKVSTALELGSKHEFDLVISDIGLPDGNGFDVMTELRRLQPHVLGIALSGFGMEHDLQRSREAGFLVHLTKPVDMTVLDRTIENVRHQEAVES
ncbi:MAG: response regulator, partial [Verrucomicrobiaceae bacterium]